VGGVESDGAGRQRPGRPKVWAILVLATLALPGEAAVHPEGSPALVAKGKAVALERAAAAGGTHRVDSPRLTRAEAQAVDPRGVKPLSNPLTCLARTLYWEARGENARGMDSVALVVMNRLQSPKFPDTVCGVVKQGGEGRRGACQFSWWCDGRPDAVHSRELGRYQLAKEIAREALNHQIKDCTRGAFYYHRQGLTPAWARVFRRTAHIGPHIFYRPRRTRHGSIIGESL
jgi:spore germination cell wall hydrolase CwlJ-like protein